MAYTQIALERDGASAVIRLNRPEKHNAISRTMSAELIECLDALEEDDGVRVLILTGSGERAFCAGADMAQAALEGRPAVGGSRDWAARAALRLLRVRKPLIAAVNGYAYGGGALFAVNCDIRVCSEAARFRFVGATYGLVVGGSQLPRVVGGPMAKELLFTARTVDAEEALRIGLANRVVAAERLAAEAAEMAALIAANSPAAVQASKEVVDIATSARDAARRELEHNLALRESAEHRERFRAAAERVVKPD